MLPTTDRHLVDQPLEVEEGGSLPGNDHVVRHIPPGKIGKDGRPTAAAFMEKKGSISVNWLECFGSRDIPKGLEGVRRDLAEVRTLKPTHQLGVLRVGAILEAVPAGDVIWDPLPQSRSHSGIVGCSDAYRTKLAKLLDVGDLFPAVPPRSED